MATILQGSSTAEYDGGPEFAQVFVIVWIGSAIVTLNSKLLGGNMWVIWLQLWDRFVFVLLRSVDNAKLKNKKSPLSRTDPFSNRSVYLATALHLS